MGGFAASGKVSVLLQPGGIKDSGQTALLALPYVAVWIT